MDYKKIYSCGSSFSCSGGLNWPEVKTLYHTLHNIEIDDEEINNSYPNLIAKLNNTPIVNESIPGGSINRLIRKTYQYIHNHQIDSKDTLFLLELPPVWRDEFYSNEFDKTFNITWGVLKDINDKTHISKEYTKTESLTIREHLLPYFDKFINTDFEIKKSMNNVLGLISYLKISNFKYVIINGFDFYSFLLKNNLSLDYNFYWVDGIIEPIHISFATKKLTITLELDNQYIDNHLGYFGNQYISKNLNNVIKNSL